jgi:hypothetical protein
VTHYRIKYVQWNSVPAKKTTKPSVTQMRKMEAPLFSDRFCGYFPPPAL